jgi:hypothetical protein
MKELDGDAALHVEEVCALIPSRRYRYSTLKHAGKALSKFGYDLVPGKFGTDNKKEILSLKDGGWILQVKYWMDGQPCNVNPPNTQYHCIVFLAARRMLVDNDEYGSVDEIDPKETMNKQYATECFLKLLEEAVQTYVMSAWQVRKKCL